MRKERLAALRDRNENENENENEEREREREHETEAVRLSRYDTANDRKTQAEKKETQVSRGSSPSPSIGYRLHV
jgi:hypothetical protein